MFPGATDEREGTDTRGRESDRGGANFVVVGAPLDATTTFRPGTRFGPRRIRTFAEPFDDYDHRTDRHFSELGVVDRGDVRAWNDVADYLEYLTSTLREPVREHAVPLLLGGEHTVSLAGVRAVEPAVFVCCDAHLDLYDAYDGERFSHAAITRRVLEDVDSVAEAILLGVRTGSEAEWDRAADDDVTVVPPEDVPNWDPGDRLADREVYLSVDVDAVDPGYAPGTGTPEPFGLEPRDLRDVVRDVAPHADGFDVVEVNDRDDGQAAALAAKLVREFVFAHADG